MTDRDAYEARNRAIGEMDAATLRRDAAPILARINAAREAYFRLADLIGATAAEQAVTAIVEAGDRVIDVTVINWWRPTAGPSITARWPRNRRGTRSRTRGRSLSTACASAPYAESWSD
ncbi:hypothetical protein ACFSVJ_28975 [Prauserella oleivorans]|uniref:Uncharacterized protein n=2 Tax=Prauserella TaxID=142577 RepID=A0A2V4AW11_9PSEU|nr:hypothetical protein [Prauserella muralis]PXY25433.1 hypothetical protein BAY60_18845 [Prauserella muralis]